VVGKGYWGNIGQAYGRRGWDVGAGLGAWGQRRSISCHNSKYVGLRGFVMIGMGILGKGKGGASADTISG